MKVNRRVFIVSGLLSLSGFLYWKIPSIIADDIELFFSNYESAIPAEDALNVDNQISLFEEKLFTMLSSEGVNKTATFINQMIKNEYQSGRVKLMNGWIVSEIELSILALRKKYV